MVVNGVLKVGRGDQVHSFLFQHGWISGRPPESEGEIRASLDLRGGGDRTFNIQLEPVSQGVLRRLGRLVRILPQTTHLGFSGWEMGFDERASLLMDEVAIQGLSVSSLGLESGNEDFVWWLETQASFDDGIALLRNPLKRVVDLEAV